ncbi:hypothetical protein RSOL_064840, partial [Rhizoctonia solani AG-3 Rhs1AP]
MQTISQRFWAIQEMQLAIIQHLDGQTCRHMAITSRANYQRFLAHGWQELVGIGNLFAILHDTLSVTPTGTNCPTVEIPPRYELNKTRILRFLAHAALVKTIDVHSNPDRFVHWQGLKHLHGLPVTANRTVVMPAVTHFRINVGKKHKRVEVAPFIHLVANLGLQEIWVSPNISQLYPRSSYEDVTEALDVLSWCSGGRVSLRRLAIYPDEQLSRDRKIGYMLDPLFTVTADLRSLTTSIALFCHYLIHHLSVVPLERLEVQGHPLDHYKRDTSEFAEVELGEGAFSNLRHLLLQQVPIDFACDLLRVRSLANNVVVLHMETYERVYELAQQRFLDTLQLLAQCTMLSELTFAVTIRNRYEIYTTYRIMAASLQPLIQQGLEVLRLSHVEIEDSEGFQQFHYPDPVISYWANLRVLTITRQDLTANDMQYFAQLPNLVELGGNVALALTTPPNKPATNVFAKELTLSSQYRFFRHFDPNTDSCFIAAIVSFLDTMTPNGMVMKIDRLFIIGYVYDERDAVWLREILEGLKESGKKTPTALEWVSAL